MVVSQTTLATLVPIASSLPSGRKDATGFDDPAGTVRTIRPEGTLTGSHIVNREFAALGQMFGRLRHEGLATTKGQSNLATE
jgi:hypothetical protein